MVHWVAFLTFTCLFFLCRRWPFNCICGMFYSLCSALLENASWSYHLDNLASHQSLYQDFGKDSMWFLEIYLDIITGKTDAENCYDDCRSMQPENETLSLISSLLAILNVDRQWPWIPHPLESYVHCGVPLSSPQVFGTPEPLMQNTDSSFVVSFCSCGWEREWALACFKPSTRWLLAESGCK